MEDADHALQGKLPFTPWRVKGIKAGKLTTLAQFRYSVSSKSSKSARRTHDNKNERLQRSYHI